MEIAKLPYLAAVYQETLRMYPVIPILFPRIAKSANSVRSCAVFTLLVGISAKAQLQAF